MRPTRNRAKHATSVPEESLSALFTSWAWVNERSKSLKLRFGPVRVERGTAGAALSVRSWSRRRAQVRTGEPLARRDRVANRQRQLLPRPGDPPLRQGRRAGALHDPAGEPTINGMAEAFVRTLKRDYVRVSPVPDAETVLRQLPSWLRTTTRFTPTARWATVRPVSSSPDQPQRACPGIKGQQQLAYNRVYFLSARLTMS